MSVDVNGGLSVTRYHDISCGHRIVGHEGSCRFLHGHNYRIFFTCVVGGVDSLGRVVDFSVIKNRLCGWLDENWDHRFLIWEKDPYLSVLLDLTPESLAVVPFNPTVEMMADYILRVVGPRVLFDEDALLVEVKIEETARCSAWTGVTKADALYLKGIAASDLAKGVWGPVQLSLPLDEHASLRRFPLSGNVVSLPVQPVRSSTAVSSSGTVGSGVIGDWLEDGEPDFFNIGISDKSAPEKK